MDYARPYAYIETRALAYEGAGFYAWHETNMRREGTDAADARAKVIEAWRANGNVYPSPTVRVVVVG